MYIFINIITIQPVLSGEYYTKFNAYLKKKAFFVKKWQNSLSIDVASSKSS